MFTRFRLLSIGGVSLLTFPPALESQVRLERCTLCSHPGAIREQVLARVKTPKNATDTTSQLEQVLVGPVDAHAAQAPGPAADPVPGHGQPQGALQLAQPGPVQRVPLARARVRWGSQPLE